MHSLPRAGAFLRLSRLHAIHSMQHYQMLSFIGIHLFVIGCREWLLDDTRADAAVVLGYALKRCAFLHDHCIGLNLPARSSSAAWWRQHASAGALPHLSNGAMSLPGTARPQRRSDYVWMQLWDCIRRCSPPCIINANHADTTSCVCNMLSRREARDICVTAHLMNLQDRVHSLLFSEYTACSSVAATQVTSRWHPVFLVATLVMPAQCSANSRSIRGKNPGLQAAICCAGGGLRTISEAEAMKRYAEAVTRGGIPQANIVLEEVGTHPGLCCSGLSASRFAGSHACLNASTDCEGV